MASIPQEGFDSYLLINPESDLLMRLLCQTPPSYHGFLGYFFDSITGKYSSNM